MSEMQSNIADDEVGPAALLVGGEPIGIAFYPEHATKADLVARMHALAAPRNVHEVASGDAWRRSTPGSSPDGRWAR